MDILILVAAMIVVGGIIGWLAGFIWKGNRPIGVSGDYYAAIITTVVVGLLDFFVIPAIGFSDTLKWFGVALEPPLAALLVLWIIRRVKR